jgi:asparagine synthase (glutamine-hydrolysing)
MDGVAGEGPFLSFHGRIYNREELKDRFSVRGGGDVPRFLARLVGRIREEGADAVLSRLLTLLDGEYAIALTLEGVTALATDPTGCQTLYYDPTGFSTDRGFFLRSHRAGPVAPGEVVLLSPSGVRKEKVLDLFRSKEVAGDPAALLDRALERAVKKRTEDGKIGLLYSAGLDSSLLARIVEDLGREAVLYSVGMEGSPDLESVRSLPDLDLDLALIELEVSDLEGILREVLRLLGEASPLHVGIGVPLYAALRKAGEEGREAVLCGQGADELFGGYRRYLSLRRGELQEALLSDLRGLYRENSPRDNALADALGLFLSRPYLDRDLILLGLGIPPSLKVQRGERKHILREVGRRRGLPEKVWRREKKAIQYASGVDRALRGLARKKGLPLRAYLERVLEEERE